MDFPETLQVQTLRLFTALSLVRQDWRGTLLLGVGLGEAGRALALAALASGAAGLFLESDLAAFRMAQREGCCTFSVHSLEEAVRALKNEVRQGRAITVALRGAMAVNLTEIVRRGLQPEVIGFSGVPQESEQEHCKVLIGRGSVMLSGLGLASLSLGLDLTATLAEALGTTCKIRCETSQTMLERRKRDAARIAAPQRSTDLTALSSAAQRWLQVAPSLFPRALSRAYLADASDA